MSDPFMAEIRIFAGNFAPRTWAFCDGQTLPIAQNTALFSLIGTIYGGDGQTTVGLPDLRGRAPMGPGTGPGLTARSMGQKTGTGTVTLTSSQIPSHTHGQYGTTAIGRTNVPSNTVTFSRARGALPYQSDTANNLVDLNSQAISNAGQSAAHSNVQPFLGIYFIICLEGIYPSEN